MRARAVGKAGTQKPARAFSRAGLFFAYRSADILIVLRGAVHQQEGEDEHRRNERHEEPAAVHLLHRRDVVVRAVQQHRHEDGKRPVATEAR